MTDLEGSKLMFDLCVALSKLLGKSTQEVTVKARPGTYKVHVTINMEMTTAEVEHIVLEAARERVQ
jgi:hypothetical protein